MSWKTVTLGILTATALLSAPAAAGAPAQETLVGSPCVEIETDPPGVVIDPESCIPGPDDPGTTPFLRS